MKNPFIALFVAALLGLAACSRSDNKIVVATPTPNPNLKKDAERLQQATMNAARQREKAAQARATASPSVTPATP